MVSPSSLRRDSLGNNRKKRICKAKEKKGGAFCRGGIEKLNRIVTGTVYKWEKK